MKIAIVGSRDYTDYERMCKILHTFGFDNEGNEIVSGDCKKGADVLAKAFAEDANLKYTGFPADWNGKAGKGAGFIRNKKIVEYSDFIIVFWNGTSPGSANVLKHAHDLRKPTFIIYHS